MSKSSWKQKIEEIAKRDRESKKMICSKCGKECIGLSETTKPLNKLSGSYVVSQCCQAPVEVEYKAPRGGNSLADDKPETNINEWLDLDIKDIPRDFFVNDRYEYQLKARKDGVWESTIYTKLDVIENLFYGNFYFRYRLKPLESIRITKRLEHLIYSQINTGDLGVFRIQRGIYTVIDGHKVEII